MPKPPVSAPSTPTPPALVVVQLPVDALEPNPWNPNVMDQTTRAKLSAYLRLRGLLQPLVVRPLPYAPGRYQLLGGYHRWLLCK